MTQADSPWQAWFPPGLDPEAAAAIGTAYWDESPHLAAALAWEAYAATLPPTPAVAQVQTGAQSVTYDPPGPAGEYGLALARAAWHRSYLGNTDSVPLAVAHAAWGPGLLGLTPTWGIDP